MGRVVLEQERLRVNKVEVWRGKRIRRADRAVHKTSGLSLVN